MPADVRKEHSHSVRTSLKEWGTSRAVRIPKPICEQAGISAGSELTMQSGQDDRGAFIMLRPISRDAHRAVDVPYISMDEVFAGYKGSYVPCEADWGHDVGAEVVE